MGVISMFLIIFLFAIVIFVVVPLAKHDKKMNELYQELQTNVQKLLGVSGWNSVPFIDDTVNVKSRQSLDKYDEIKYFKENNYALDKAVKSIENKN